jgi:AbrB family looped-hinge helix DNA binding protein
MPARRYFSSVSPKGQITLPVEIRKELGLQPRDQVEIELRDGQVTVQPATSRLLRHYQRAGKLEKPLTWTQIEEIAHEDQALHVVRDEMGEEIG